jgi:sugar/nucleoside kinase (ribokinase family)
MTSSRPLPLQVIASLKAAAAQLDDTKVLVGFDGFVDNILHVVKTRESATKYTRMERMTDFAERISSAAGLSANMEMVVQMQKLGGNGPIMANALGALGSAVTYIGNLGEGTVHPVFSEFAKTAKVHSIAEPGVTDAIEFDDGKLMFGKHASLREVNWANLLKHVPEKQLVKIFSQSRFIAMVNWTMLTQMKGIFQKVASVIAPQLTGPKRILFFDLADPEKRSAEDIREALKQISKFEKHFRVVLGLNLRESYQVGEVLGVEHPGESEVDVTAHALRLRELLDIDTVVVHPTQFAAAANQHGATCVTGPYTPKPKITTGAGDHFNAGFCTGLILGLDLAQSLQIGVATSGYYVRNAKSPKISDLSKFLKTL